MVNSSSVAEESDLSVAGEEAPLSTSQVSNPLKMQQVRLQELSPWFTKAMR